MPDVEMIDRAREYARQNWIGRKVISRTNESEPSMVGELVRWEPVSKSGRLCPVVQDTTGQEWICMGILLPFSQVLYEALEAMDPKEAWDWCKDFSSITQVRLYR